MSAHFGGSQANGAIGNWPLSGFTSTTPRSLPSRDVKGKDPPYPKGGVSKSRDYSHPRGPVPKTIRRDVDIFIAQQTESHPQQRHSNRTSVVVYLLHAQK